jgi:tellurite resistance protein TerC
MQLHTIVANELWYAFGIGVVLMLALDLFVLHRPGQADSQFKGIMLSLMWIAIALTFNFWFGYQYGADPGMQFLSGYLIEKSLSIDNLFIIMVIFESLNIQKRYQHGVLFWGILGAVVFRGIFILVGVKIIEVFHPILYVFGGILVYTAYKLIRDKEDEHKDPSEHFVAKLVRKMIPVCSDSQGEHFFIKKNGIWHATTLFIALIVIEFTDIIFAVDSIPAVFSVTRDPFIAFASNILALLGLRALYFVIAGAISKMKYLKPGLAVILGFVGVKMLIIDIYHFPSWVSLSVILGVFLVAGLLSFKKGA